jgi:hypothetical protein
MSNLRAIGARAPAPPEEGYSYPEKYVAFVDILSFSDLVERADQDTELRKSLAEVSHVFQTTCGTFPATGTRVTQFSDSLVIRYAPFSSSGAMLGYLLDGAADEALANIAARLLTDFTQTKPLDPGRPHRSSKHDRTVPSGKDYPSPFRCHHLILGFHGLARHRGTA